MVAVLALRKASIGWVFSLLTDAVSQLASSLENIDHAVVRKLRAAFGRADFRMNEGRDHDESRKQSLFKAL